MKRIIGIPRRWIGATMVVVLAALLTVPWTFWVIVSAYQRDLTEKVDRLQKRVMIHVATYRPNPLLPPWMQDKDDILDPIKTELMEDESVQALVFLDFRRGRGGNVLRNDSIAFPRNQEQARAFAAKGGARIYKEFTAAEMNKMLRASPAPTTGPAAHELAGGVYIELSPQKLRENFWKQEHGLLKTVGVTTAIGTLLLATAGVIAFNIWRSSFYQRERARLEQQGMLAQRGLTAAVLAHEIRNPLQALGFQIQTVRRNAGDPERISATADTIETELQRIQRLVQDFLAHEKAQALHVAPVPLAQAVQGLETLIGEMLQQNDTRLAVQAPAEAVTVLCDPDALRQILLNLVLNAQQAMGRGGLILIGIGCEPPFGTISVADTGPGIPPEMRDRIFKPFATSRKEGSGIGLALVKRFVDNFGGKVEFATEMGRGTTFVLRLPLAPGFGNQGGPVPAEALPA